MERAMMMTLWEKKHGLFPIPLAKTVHIGFSMKGCTYC